MTEGSVQEISGLMISSVKILHGDFGSEIMVTRPSMSQPHESEIALLVTRCGREIVEDFAGTKSILHYDLKPRPVERIRDTYFDTVTGSVRKRRMVVRLRMLNRRLFITLKSNPRLLEGKGVRRTEIELPWSQESLSRVSGILGVKSRAVAGRNFSSLSPVRVLATLGLQRVQERVTVRQVRDVFDRGALRQRIAEIAIDQTTFIIKRARMKIIEVEIEAKKTGLFPRVQKLAEALVARYPSSIRHWVYGKLLTGLAIQSLLEKGKLKRHVGNVELTERAFRLIEQEIRSRKL